MQSVPLPIRSPSEPAPHDVLASLRGEPHAFVPAGPHRLAYRKFGQGPDLVFVHGWPLHSATFRALVPLLATRFTCHLFDLPGSGRTQSPDGAPVDLSSHATALRAAVDALGLRRYALIAHDSGGFSARLLAAEDPRVVALVSGDTEIPGHTPAVIKTLLLATKAPGGAELMRLSFPLPDATPLGHGVRGMLHRPRGHRRRLPRAPDSAAARRASRRGAPGGDPPFGRTPRWALCAARPMLRIAAPVLFVWGDADPIFPLEKARTMLPALRRARLEVLPGAKCFLHEERAPEFAALAAPFLAEAFASPGN